MDSKEMAPGDIERRSFEIITEELGGRTFPPLEEPVVKRVIHTTADFSYADSLVFTHDAAHCALDALRAGATVLTDTNMALAGISKPALAKIGCQAVCYMADPDVAATARAAGTTRAVARAWTKLAASRVRSSWPSATLPQHFCASPSSWTRGRSRPRSSLGCRLGL